MAHKVDYISSVWGMGSGGGSGRDRINKKHAPNKFNVSHGAEGRRGSEEDRDLPEYRSII